MSEPMEGVEYYSHETETSPLTLKTTEEEMELVQMILENKIYQSIIFYDSVLRSLTRKVLNVQFFGNVIIFASQTRDISGYNVPMVRKHVGRTLEAEYLRHLAQLPIEKRAYVAPDKHYHFSFKLFVEFLDSCKDKDIIVIPLLIPEHANVIIINKRLKSIELFDPHGVWAEVTEYYNIRNSVRKMLRELIKYSPEHLKGFKICLPDCTRSKDMGRIIGTGRAYVQRITGDPDNSIPVTGPQVTISHDVKYSTTCVLWSIWISYLRIQPEYQDMRADEVSNIFLDTLKVHDSMEVLISLLRLIVMSSNIELVKEDDLEFIKLNGKLIPIAPTGDLPYIPLKSTVTAFSDPEVIKNPPESPEVPYYSRGRSVITLEKRGIQKKKDKTKKLRRLLK